MFYKVAAGLAGVKVTQAQVDSQQSYVQIDQDASMS